MMIGEIVLTVLAGWFAIGAVIATLFVIFGVGRVDHAAQGASFLFPPDYLPWLHRFMAGYFSALVFWKEDQRTD